MTDTLTEWTAQARASTPDNPPDLGLLLEALTGSAFFKAARIDERPDSKGRPMIAFDADAPEQHGLPVLTRRMPPVYVAITRCIELAGGQMMFVQQKDSGRKRYAVRLSGLVTLTNLNRVLFDVPPAPRLYERADADYHDIAPSTYHVSAGPSRADVIRAVTERDAALGSLLQDLFALADLWHDDELTA